MLLVNLQDLDYSHIDSLVQARVEEGPQLEFKQALDLGSPSKNREAAKDIAAMANSAGGRIFYGIVAADEDGSKVAVSVKPISDKSVADQLRDVVSGLVTPVPSTRSFWIECPDDGSVLVYEVDKSPYTLHGLLYKEEIRWRRGNRRNEPMTLEEVGTTFERMALGKQNVEAVLPSRLESVRQLAGDFDQFFAVVPWQSLGDVVNPKDHRKIGALLDGELGAISKTIGLETRLRPVAGGLLAEFQHPEYPFRFGVTRDGCIFFTQGAFIFQSGAHVHTAIPAMVDSLKALELLTRDTYLSYSPVSLFHRVEVPGNQDYEMRGKRLPTGVSLDREDLVSLRDPWEPAIGSLFDQLIHRAGGSRANFFDDDGFITDEWRSRLWRDWSAKPPGKR